METKSQQARPGQFLTFILKEQPYGVPIGVIREINRVTDITHVPQTQDFVAGVMNLRGKVIPVLDLRLKLGMEKSKHTKATCIIVIESEDAQTGQVGMIVDSVQGVSDLSAQQIEPAPQLGNSNNTHVMGMGKMDSQVIILLDLVKCLSEISLMNLTPGQAPKAQAS